MTMTDPRTEPQVEARRPGDPAPDLLDYRLVHRAMTTDSRRLARAAAELTERPDRRRMTALRHYLNAMTGEVDSHHHVEDDDVWPLLAAVAGEQQPAFDALIGDHERLDPLLRRARDLVATNRSTPQLVASLDELADLLARHVADEERDIFPLIEDYVRVGDYRRLQRRFRGNLRLRLLPFVVPWVVSQATAEERPDVIASAEWPLRVVLALFERRFRALQRRVFGTPGLSRRDRGRVRRMRRFARIHRAVLRRSRGRIGSRWLGGNEVLTLTTTGRRSGQRHSVPLMYLPDGDDLLVVASQAGVDREPQWWLNLLADPRADVDIGGHRFAVSATRVSDDDRHVLWARLVAAYPGFERYQAKVRRQIAVVRLRSE